MPQYLYVVTTYKDQPHNIEQHQTVDHQDNPKPYIHIPNQFYFSTGCTGIINMNQPTGYYRKISIIFINSAEVYNVGIYIYFQNTIYPTVTVLKSIFK